MILHMLIVMSAGWIQRHQQQVISYLIEENRSLQSQRKTIKAGQSCAEIVSVGCCATITERRRDARRCFSTIRG